MRWKKMQYEMPVETELEEYVRREGTPEDWSKMKQIKKGENLESFLTDKNWVIRGLLVEKGYFLDILVNDSDSLVRQRVARYGTDKHLAILINDVDEIVRMHVAWRQYGLEKLIHDKSEDVRWGVAEYCKDDKYLNILLHDESPEVRRAVARRGNGLEILKKDKDSWTASVAKDMIIKQTLRNLTANRAGD